MTRNLPTQRFTEAVDIHVDQAGNAMIACSDTGISGMVRRAILMRNAIALEFEEKHGAIVRLIVQISEALVETMEWALAKGCGLLFYEMRDGRPRVRHIDVPVQCGY